ncbi:glucan biosynthesis protein [Blastopirellula retiformator]|uniref:Glucans biosynthesis protein D n=1 Tax=Blastopirellula retiformator TaxID=2527970 RepID=A0A5C5V2C5_9BACT|nr:glucan biosynthesis protein D [Blastopirellula retiformator]TWT32123.1 Glucans biosynthesis protein D precursor [Blastopirellula retiformator]
MQRRELLKKAAAALAATALPWTSLLDAAAHAGLKPLGKPQAFSFDALKKQARQLASQEYVAPRDTLPEPIAKLDWDQWQSIRFDDEQSLWREDDLAFQARFFHLGFTIKTPVRMFEVKDGQAQELAYDAEMFDYDKSGVSPETLPPDLGFAGFRLNFESDWMRDVAAFQGASYFRAVGGDKQYGQSARGLAIDCGMGYPEEFPNFIAYYLEQPAEGSKTVTVYGLLDSPSVSGAYRFLMTPGESFVMDIDAALYPRKEIARLGIAPLTSMYQYGENDQRMANDWRPEIHDTDGLQMWTGRGEWIWRPLVNPEGVRINSFMDDNPRGFGLLQRDHDFDHYQDDGVFYDLRPSVWVEPKLGADGKGWGKGSVMLVEIPTVDETFDNIVAFWNPTEKPQPGQEVEFGYKLTWGATTPAKPTGAIVRATRTGIGGVVGQPRKYFSWRFAIDFARGTLDKLPKDAKVEPVIEASRGKVEITSARPLFDLNGDGVSGYRAMFDLKPTDTSLEPINIRLYLQSEDHTLSETWLYQWTPPSNLKELAPELWDEAKT